MKLLVSILACIVLFLSTQCMIVEVAPIQKAASKKSSSCCSKKTTCSKKQEPKKDCSKEKDKDCKDACNPFMACCGCLYDGVPKITFNINKPVDYPDKSGYKEIFLPSPYIPGLWQPPEVVV